MNAVEAKRPLSLFYVANMEDKGLSFSHPSSVQHNSRCRVGATPAFRPYHTLSVPDNVTSESLLVLIVPKPACRNFGLARHLTAANFP